ncbi:MAG: 2-oxoglutarate dehydrogenase, E2 component, dihydrolipoamide succinyltransferase [Candidatus Kapaibacteriota bacterium]
MKVDVVMPKMGESLQEGTILRWLKKVGDRVERDEMILEISTDKVDTEVPSPVSGVIVEILANENETVPVGAVIARIETESVETVTETKVEEPPKVEFQQPEVATSEPTKEFVEKDETRNDSLVDVVMPKMGESLQEGTILRWLKKVGDRVERDEMILEISTDKVDTEVPSPVSGVIVEILANENETVPVGAVIARISTGEGTIVEKQPEKTKVQEVKKESTVERVQPDIEQQKEDGKKAKQREGRNFFSPVVKEIAKQEGISDEELMTIKGSGLEGRVTKNDLLKYIEEKKSKKVASQQVAKVEQEKVPEAKIVPPIAPAPTITTYGPDVEIIPMDRVRQIIAQHMVYSKQTSAHVTSVHEADVTGIVRFREKFKDEFERREGFKLTYTPFFAKAAVEAIRAYPRVNVSVDGTNIIQHKRIHLGIATALEDGNLIVPVVKNADSLSLPGLARAIFDLSSRARSKKLNPEDIQGGTFTLTNVGTFGTLFGTPVINQPQTAILGVGAIQKRPVVRTIDGEDVIVVRYMAYVSLTYDHRVIDGMLAGLYLTELVRLLESQSEKTLSI